MPIIGTIAATVGALLALAMIGWSEARLSAALKFARDAVRRASIGSDIGRRALPRLILVSMLTSVGLLDEARTVVSALSTDVKALGPTVHGASPEILAALVDLAAGRQAEAIVSAESGIGRADVLGAHMLTPFGLSILAAAALRSGDPRGAMEYATAIQARLPATRPHMDGPIASW